MANIKRTQKPPNLFWRIVISAVGIALIFLAVMNMMLFLFGETADADVNIRRVGGADNGRPADQRYEWSLDYEFEDKTGNIYSGHTARRGGDIAVNVDNEVYYFEFAPFLNALESEARPNLSQPIFILIGGFLIYIINK